MDAFAGQFARTLRPGDVVALRGPLGAGKTTLVRALVRALHGSDDAVSSPTFVFRQRYDAPPASPGRGKPSIEHLDLFRIDDPTRELPDLALDEAFEPDRIVLVEWPERAEGWLPVTRIEVAIDGSGDGPRTVRVDRPPAE